MKLSNVRIDPMQTPPWRHIFLRINASDFAGFAMLVAPVLIVLDSFINYAVADDGGVQQHKGSHPFRIRYARAH